MGTVLANVDGDLNISVKEEFGFTEEAATEAITNPLYIRPKDHPNELMVAINGLPVELLIYIILLANLSIDTLRGAHAHPYLSYTWVCRHWRSILIHSPVFWTLIPPRSVRKRHIIQKKNYREIFGRSGSSQIDAILSHKRSPFNKMIKDLLAKESSRIRTFQLFDSRRLALSGLHLPSLRGFALISRYSRPGPEHLSIFQLLPILTASNHLDTFQCTLYNNEWASACKDQMTLIFSRLRNLSLTLESAEIVGPVLDLLQNNARLQSLQLSIQTYTSGIISFGRLILPELQLLSIQNLYLMDHIQCPKLSSVSADHRCAPHAPDHMILKESDLSSIKYLWIQQTCQRDTFSYCILGAKERIDCNAVFSVRTDILFGDYPICEYPRDCFHLKFYSANTFTPVLQEALSSIIPQLTNLIEVHLLFPPEYSVCQEITHQSSSVRKIIVVSGNGLLPHTLLRLLRNPSRCPQLIHLSYTMGPLLKNPEEYAYNVGWDLINCLQFRRNDSASNVALKYIHLGNCPPLPDI